MVSVQHGIVFSVASKVKDLDKAVVLSCVGRIVGITIATSPLLHEVSNVRKVKSVVFTAVIGYHRVVEAVNLEKWLGRARRLAAAPICSKDWIVRPGDGCKCPGFGVSLIKN
jgi:hypothetical protein